MGTILAVDPGTLESAYVMVDEETLRPLEIGKVSNNHLLSVLCSSEIFDIWNIKHFVIEMVAGMGQSVGQETFDTAFWIGRFWEAVRNIQDVPRTKIFRRHEKTFIAKTQKCKDADIIRLLVNRFAPGQLNNGKGTEKNPGWFYGFKADIWQAYAVAVTYHHFYLTESGRSQFQAMERKRMINKAKKEEKKKNGRKKKDI